MGCGSGEGLGDLVVAVDGPSGSGKSTTARGVARRLGLRYLDTGALYRAMTWAMLRDGVDPTDAISVAEHATLPRLAAGTDPDAPTITVDGTDVAGPIRGPEVTAAVSAVSAVPAVRRTLLAVQRGLIGDGGIVVEGRDIGSVVVPDARVKVFLTADASERARRRHAEFAALWGPGAERGGDPSGTGGAAPTGTSSAAEREGAAVLDKTLDDLARRDRLDSTRRISPLVQAADAVVLDTTALGVEEAVARVCELAQERTGANGSGDRGADRASDRARDQAAGSDRR